jgi:hypothetical protein
LDLSSIPSSEKGDGMSLNQGDKRAFVSPVYFRFLSTSALLLGALAGYPLLETRLATVGQGIYLALMAGLGVACVLAWWHLNAERSRRLALWIRGHRFFVWSFGLLATGGALAAWVVSAEVRWTWPVLPQVAWLTLPGLVLFWLVFSGELRSRLLGTTGRVVFVLGCVAATYLALDLILRAAPALVPEAAWRHLHDPGLRLHSSYAFFDKPVSMGYRYRPNRDEWEVCRDTGLPPFRVHVTTDENGFRNTPPLAQQYDLVATGDSFTAGDFVDDPWPQLVGQFTGLPVLNLGVRGWGPQAEVAAIQAFGLLHNPSWVMVGFYEGNDLQDAAIYQQIQASGLDWVTWSRSMVEPQPMDSWLAWQSLRYGLYDGFSRALGAAEKGKTASRRFPLMVEVGGQMVSLAFYDNQTALLSASQSDIEASTNFALTEAALGELKAACDAQGARLLLVYMPAKEHVYLPLIDDDQAVATILAGAGSVSLDGDGYVLVDSSPLAQEVLWTHLDDQRRALQALAERLGLDFLDLTPSFQTETARGRSLYFPINAHWNQEGQQLAAEAVATYLLQNQ